MGMLNSWLVAASRRWWLFGRIFVLNVVSLEVLFAVVDRFEAIAGVATFATQNSVTVATLLAQLPRYQGAAHAA